MKKPPFIAFEGIDGCGKSTQAKLLAQKLIEDGNQVNLTNEPTNGAIGKMIRQIFSGQVSADERVIAGLFVADRLEHVLNQDNGMLHLLEKGQIVITDRYYFSSYAYHSVHTDMQWVINSNAMAASLLRPDVTIYIDILPEESMKRLTKSRASLEKYETLENLTAVRNKYFEAFELLKFQENIVIVDGNQDITLISDEIFNIANALI